MRLLYFPGRWAVSQPFADGDSWYLVKCVDSYDEDATLEGKKDWRCSEKIRHSGGFMTPLPENIQLRFRAASGKM